VAVGRRFRLHIAGLHRLAGRPNSIKHFAAWTQVFFPTRGFHDNLLAARPLATNGPADCTIRLSLEHPQPRHNPDSCARATHEYEHTQLDWLEQQHLPHVREPGPQPPICPRGLQTEDDLDHRRQARLPRQCVGHICWGRPDIRLWRLRPVHRRR
jgi:hypothetical protein